MISLFPIVCTLAGTTLAGSAIVAALSLNMVDHRSVIGAAVSGALAAIPVARIVAKRPSAA